MWHFFLQFLADHTSCSVVSSAHSAVGIIMSSVCLSVCDIVHCGQMIQPTTKLSEHVNRKCPVRNWFYNFQSLAPTLPLQTPHLLHHRCWCHLENKLELETYLGLCSVMLPDSPMMFQQTRSSRPVAKLKTASGLTWLEAHSRLTSHHMDPSDPPGHGNIGDWCSRAGWGQIVLAANCNGWMLRLIASRHDDDD